MAMKFTTLISTEGLAQFMKEPDWVIVDCRFWLEDTAKGRQDYLAEHIPGALYFDLDEDLSGPLVPGESGRHPLPDPEKLAALLGAHGIGKGTQVVAYDDRGGMIAGRLWWLLRWLGHKQTAVLDGGLTAWQAEGRPVTDEIPVPVFQPFTPDLQQYLVVNAAQVLENFGDPGRILVDSRAPERYRGESEPIDPVAGRIPGAINFFWNQNLDAKGFFEIKDVLRGRFLDMFADIPAEQVSFYCGSGVTAAHNVLAVAHAGLGMPKLYPGGWSEWIADPNRPIARDR